jgi:hypothetical protein
VKWTGWTIAYAACAGAAACAAALSCGSFGSAEPVTAPADGATGLDGGNPPADGSADGAAPPGTFCGAHTDAILCDDFDDPGRNVWGIIKRDDGGALAVSDEGGAISPPNVLVTSMAVLATNCRYAYQKAELDAPAANGFHLEFQFRTDALPGPVSFGPGVTTGKVGEERCEYYLTLGPNDARIDQEHDTITTTYTTLGRAPKAGWNTVSVDVEGVAPFRKMSVYLNEYLAIDKRLVDDTCQKADHVIGTSVGLFCIDSTVGGTVRLAFDNLLITGR